MSGWVSVLDLFSIGIGPSSSHTVGPMRAAQSFAERLTGGGPDTDVARVEVELCGSLGATGVGHGTPDAVIAGLRGEEPETCDPDQVRGSWAGLGNGREVRLAGVLPILMRRSDVVLAPRVRMPGHSNGMTFRAYTTAGVACARQVSYSVGGGFVVTEGEAPRTEMGGELPAPYVSAAELLTVCDERGQSIADIAWINECSVRPEPVLAAGLDRIWATMDACVDAGLTREGVLPGRLHVRQRAMAQRLRLESLERTDAVTGAPILDRGIEWLQAFAMAVNEENADGRRIVTAPTNGAAGIIPAVGRHYLRLHPELTANPDQRRRVMRRYLLTAGAIGGLYKRNASISGAEAGCQGEVGSACSMAAAGFAALTGGTPSQVQNAAEIAMEHHLGLTCDPVDGLVQVPCIERNAIAACTAVAASRLALQGDGRHVVSLDAVIETMRQTGLDMSTKYKETAEAGLAVNVVEC